MDVDSRILKLERQYTNDANSKYTTKIISYNLGSSATQFDITVSGLPNTIGAINITVDSSTVAYVYHNDVVVFNGTITGNISIPITACVSNHIYITFNTASFTSVSILGNFENSANSDYIIPLHDNIIYVTDTNYYIHNKNSVTIGKYDFYQNSKNIANICTFCSMSNSGLVQDVYAYYDNNSIKIFDIDGSNMLCSIAVNFVPTSLAICSASLPDTYYLFAVHGSQICVYKISNFVLVNTYNVAASGITHVASVGGDADTIACIRAGATHVVKPGVDSGNLALVCRQVDSGTSARVYYHDGKYFVLNRVGGLVNCKELNANYQVVHSATYPNVTVAYECGGQVYGLTSNYLQVLYEG